MGILGRELAVSNLRFLIGEISARLRQGADAGLVLELCARERQLGCALLLTGLDVDGFHEALLRSAASYLWLLREAQRRSDLDAYHLCKSRAAPLLDAVAAGDLAIAREVGARMVLPLQPRMESEEDFHFFDLVSGPLLDAAVKREDLAPRLAAFEKSLDGGSSERLAAVTALAGRDAGAFEAALAARTEAWAQAVERGKKADALEPYFRKTEAYVFVEGIALARLAAARGLSLPARMRFIPAEALRPPRVSAIPGYRP